MISQDQRAVHRVNICEASGNIGQASQSDTPEMQGYYIVNQLEQLTLAVCNLAKTLEARPPS